MRALAAVFLSAFLIMPFAISASVLRYSVGDHYISVNLDEEGNAKITERFYLAFKTQEDIDAFTAKKTLLGNDISEWRKFDPNFTFHIGGESYVKKESVSVFLNKEQQDHVLEIYYELKNKAVGIVSEESRIITYKTSNWIFNPFIKGADYVIPEGTFITINLPRDAEIIESDEIFKYALVEKSPPKVKLQGLISTGNLSFRYVVIKGIAPQISVSIFVKGLADIIKENAYIFGSFVIALLVISYLLKDKISNSLIGFLVKYTDFSTDEAEQD
ncbi:MAG: hypothetical protein N3F05_02480 [Candidatus Diapherotrites archaeon]|nr:hypothetical protein [Candidatus Diapherotrites archaeon]